MDDGTGFDDRLADDLDDEEQYLAAYEHADRHAAGLLREALRAAITKAPGTS